MGRVEVIGILAMAGWGILAPLVIYRSRSAPVFGKVILGIIFVAPIFAITAVPAISIRLGILGRWSSLAAFGIAFSVVEKVQRQRQASGDDDGAVGE